MSNYVYFIRPVGADGPIKIGCSFVPQRRLEDFSVWSPAPLEIIGTVPGSFGDEKFLHECFADQHSHREWFHASDQLLTTIQDILAAGSIAPAREVMKPKGSIRRGNGKPRSADFRRQHSYSLRLAWIHRRQHALGLQCRDPEEISQIMDRWAGNSYRRKPGTPPTDDEVAVLDAYLATKKAELSAKRRAQASA